LATLLMVVLEQEEVLLDVLGEFTWWDWMPSPGSAYRGLGTGHQGASRQPEGLLWRAADERR
jgi:hypothetical protein